MTITAEQLVARIWGTSLLSKALTEAQAILNEDRLATTAAVLAMAAGACAKVAWPAAYEIHPYNYGPTAPIIYDAAMSCATTISALEPDATAWLEADRAAQRKAGADEALAGAVNGWVVIVQWKRGDRIVCWTVSQTRGEAIAEFLRPNDPFPWSHYRSRGYRVAKVIVSEVLE